MFYRQLIAFAFYVLPVLSAPSPLLSVKRIKGAIPGRYIVTFKNSVDRSEGVSSIIKLSPQPNGTHEWDIIYGFAGISANHDLELLGSYPNTATIEGDGLAHTQDVSIQ